MRSQKSICSFFIAIFLAIAMISNPFASVAFAAKEQNVDQDPNSGEFMSLSKYTTPTDIPGVFQVTLTIEPAKRKYPPIFIAIGLDPSGSMAAKDIWDSTGSFNSSGNAEWISRFHSLDLSIAAFIDELKEYAESTENYNIYISLREHDQAITQTSAKSPLTTTEGFAPLYDANHALNPIFDSENKTTWIMHNWGSPRWHTAPGSGNNDMGKAMYYIHQDFAKGLISSQIAQNSSRYVLLMGDGSDNSKTNKINEFTSTFPTAMALKAPLDANYKPGGTTLPTNPAVKIGGGNKGGIGATIWTLLIGSDIHHNTAWTTEFKDAVASPTRVPLLQGTTSPITALPVYFPSWNGTTATNDRATIAVANSAGLIQVGTNTNYERSPNLILGCWVIGTPEIWAIADAMDLPTYPTTASLASGSDWKTLYQYYKDYATSVGTLTKENTHYYTSLYTRDKPSNPLTLPNTLYNKSGPINSFSNMAYYARVATPAVTWRDDSSAMLSVFEDFAKAAADVAGTPSVTDILGGNFEMYKMDGEDMLEASTNDPDPTVDMQASYKNDTLSWTFNKLNGGYRYTLKYYVKYIGPESEKDLWHATNKDAYVEYINADGETVIKNFPVPYSKPSTNEVKVEESITEEIQTNANGDTTMANPNTATGSNTTTGNVEMIGIIPNFMDAVPTYTSSNKKIETIKDKVVIYQKTTSGKYKAVATVNKGKTFTVISEESDYYKIIYQMKDAKKASTGYIKKSDAKLLTHTATTSNTKK